MIQDYLEIENAEGMPNLADGTIAMDFLLAAKNGIVNYTTALAEAKNPKARAILTNQLRETISMHKEISDLMIWKGWLHPQNLPAQMQLDLKTAQMALTIAGLELFPGNNDRVGTFATPYK